MRTRTLKGAGLCLALALTGSATASAATPSAVGWRACDDAPGFECGRLTVPLDYDGPSAERIELALIRRRADDTTTPARTLFFNSGGPGGAPTVDLPKFAPFFSAQVRARFDIVGIDPRGIGGSAQLRCFTSPRAERLALQDLPNAGFPDGAAETRRTIAVNARLARACATHGGAIQRHMSTANVARDMDRVRAVLGEQTVNYYGPSYGTYLGATYANLFPTRVGRMVLDGNVPPEQWNDARRAASMTTFARIRSAAGTEAALQMMLRACGSVDVRRCAFSAGSPAATSRKYRTLRARLRATPVRVGRQRFTAAQLTATVASGMFSQNASSIAPGWKALSRTLQALWTGSKAHATARTAQAIRSSGPAGLAPKAPAAFPAVLPEGISGVLCGESPNSTDAASYRAQEARLNATQSPSGFGSVWTWLAAPCAQWKARDADRYTGPWDRSPVPILVIGTLGDPNTAYSGSVRMAEQLENARLLTESGGGHTALVNSSSCINGHVDAFLASGALPAPGTTCAQDKAPF